MKFFPDKTEEECRIILNEYRDLSRVGRLEMWRDWLKQKISIDGKYYYADNKFTDIILEAIDQEIDPEDYLLKIYGEEFITEHWR